MTMRQRTFVIAFLALFFAAIVIPPWVTAYRGQHFMLYYYGLIDGREVKCIVTDGTFFDRYRCMILDSSADKRIRYTPEQFYLDDRPIQFPAGRNLCILQPDGQIQFMSIAEQDIAPDVSGSSEIYYIFGKVPKFKHFPFGIPRKEFVEAHFGLAVSR